jgi:hypothetical protein
MTFVIPHRWCKVTQDTCFLASIDSNAGLGSIVKRESDRDFSRNGYQTLV